MLTRAYRLRYGHKKILRFGYRKKTPFFIVIYLPNKLSTSRFSIMTTKKIGKAIVRNKVKRLFRELISQNIQQIHQGYDIIIIPSQFIPNWKENLSTKIRPLLLNILTTI